MKLWLTSPYDPDGIKVIDTIWGPDKLGHFGYDSDGMCHESGGWYVEGETFHRNEKAAVAKAREHRANWLKEVTAKASYVASLPPIQSPK